MNTDLASGVELADAVLAALAAPPKRARRRAK
jgi:hypothetical protein